MIRASLISLALLGLLVVGIAAAPFPQANHDCPPPDTPNPVLVLMEFNPWLMVIGSDAPSFVLYDDGTVIFRDAETFDYFTVTLDDEDKAAMREVIDVDAFFALEEYYDGVPVTDQPSNVIYVWHADDMKRVGAYGDLRSDRPYGADIPSARDTVPDVLLDAFDMMAFYEHEKADPWLPEFIEVMVWPHNTLDFADWPDEWPSLNDECAVQRGEDSYSIYLPSEYLDDLVDMRQDHNAVLLNGESRAFAWRYPFASEQQWMNLAQ